MKLLLIFYLLLAFNSYSQLKKTTELVTYPDGEVDSLIYYVNSSGMADSTFLVYGSKGELKFKGYNIQGLLQGPYYGYYPSGKIDYYSVYRNNLPSDLTIRYYPDACPKQVYVKQEGEMRISIDYFDSGSGQIMQIYTYLPTMIKIQQFHRNGFLRAVYETDLKGKLLNCRKEYNEKGKLIKTECP